MSIFKGAGVAIVTPMHADGSVNFEKMRELVRMQIEGHTDAIIVCGTTGECATLSTREHLDVISCVVEETAGRIPVIAGTGSNCTETSIYLSREAEKRGADAVLLVSPYYNKATQNGLKKHFASTAEAISIPAILYNIPSRTGCNILPETMAWLYQNVENIVGVKEACGDIAQIGRLMSLVDDDFELYSGNDGEIVPQLALGGLGVISVLSNIAPQQTHDITAAWFEGDLKKSRDLQRKASALIDALFCEVNPIPVKKAMNLMGLEVGPLRAPLYEMEEKDADRLAGAMREYGLL